PSKRARTRWPEERSYGFHDGRDIPVERTFDRRAVMSGPRLIFSLGEALLVAAASPVLESVHRIPPTGTQPRQILIHREPLSLQTKILQEIMQLAFVVTLDDTDKIESVRTASLEVLAALVSARPALLRAADLHRTAVRGLQKIRHPPAITAARRL